ncbi:MAG: HD domain-containing protein [Gemmatimonadota bacterium]|nr:HD domain-containing protein [Gemmatimonadota bacterium]
MSDVGTRARTRAGAPAPQAAGMEMQARAARFLTALAQAVSARSLYAREHPAVERAVRAAHGELVGLQSQEPHPVLTFLGGEVLLGSRPLRTLRTWEWGPKLAEVGVQRFECHGPVTRPDLDAFVEVLFQRLSSPEVGPVEPDPASAIRFGAVGIRSAVEDTTDADIDWIRYSLAEEIAAMRWLDGEARAGGRLHLVEVETIVRSLAVAMHADWEMMIPLVELKGFDQYTTTHSLNIAVLAMALGEFLEIESTDVRRLGVAGLLHDIGKTRVSKELLVKPGTLEPRELAEIRRHPVEGARMLIARQANLDLAATVAYEHHIRHDGGGYPKRRFTRACHPASDLVHLCDVYDALRTHRPYRKAWSQDRTLAYLEQGLGTEFEPVLGKAFLEMMRRWGPKLRRVTAREDAVGPGEPDRTVEQG